LRKRGLEPSQENIEQTIRDNKLKRNNYVKKFVDLLDTLEGPWTIALDARWGAGKTFFVKQVKYVLDEDENQDDLIEGMAVEKSFKTVYYDAWQHDAEGRDPLLSILDSMVTGSLFDKEELIAKHRAIVSAISKLIIHQDLSKEIDELFETKSSSPNLEFKKGLENLLSNISNDRIVIFIDELDRCRPSFAVELLERIKHFFNHDKLTFVFSVNLIELKKTIQHFYGTDFDGDRYVDRFFDLVCSLPEPDVETYLEMQGVENNSLNKLYQYLASYFSLSIRELDHLIFQNDLATDLISRQAWIGVNPYMWVRKTLVQGLSPYLITLRMTDRDEFESVISGNGLESFQKCQMGNKVFLATLCDEEKIPDDILDLLKKLYDGLFNSNGQNDIRISEKMVIPSPLILRKLIIDSITLVSEYTEYKYG